MRASDPLARADLTAPPGKIPPGLPGIWSTALATAVVLALLLALLWIVTVNAVAWFWPAPVWRLTLVDGEVVVGQKVQREEAPSLTLDEDAPPRYRVNLKVGNRELTGSDFRWIDESDIASEATPPELVRIERSEYGDAFGRVEGATGPDGRPLAITSPTAVDRLLESAAEWRDERERLLAAMERTREPLTQLEEELDLRERSALAETESGQHSIAELTVRVDQLAEELGPRLAALEHDLVEVTRRLSASALELYSGTDLVRVPLGQVVEVTWPNRMGFPTRLARAVRDAVLFLVTEPREANTEGGIYPALFGTVLLVLLMSVAVVPLGVITAVYMTEYARQGIPLRLANQAVNNLAGVPSIVFGMFGLAFFVYGVGGTIDRTFFAERLPTPTFGTGGVLWASLTLALLTVPVVVIATREGLLAVPQSWRDGSLALGATKWQTLRRIILPAAMPGILTGLILAVSRAAGEVAPLMLTGAVKLAPSLPVDAQPPFLHLQRKFMHLGFHIYDVSMQSPNVEAAKPMAFATTLVLLLLVLLMNLTAIIIRRRLRRAYTGGAV